MKVALPLPGGELEYAVLAVLWDRGSASAREIYTQIGEPRALVYTTIAKVLDRLHAKRLVSRRKAGNAFTYAANIPRERIERARARTVLQRLLGPAPQPAIATLVDAIAAIDPKLIDELSRQVAARRRSRRGT